MVFPDCNDWHNNKSHSVPHINEIIKNVQDLFLFLINMSLSYKEVLIENHPLGGMK